MPISVLTTKGQTTIPREIRAYLGLHTGDKLEFLIDENGKVTLIPLTSEVTELKGILPKPKRKVSIEKMKKIITKRVSKL